MAKKKTERSKQNGRTSTLKKKTAKKTKRSPATDSPLLKSFFGLTILTAIVVLTFVLVHHFFPPEKPAKVQSQANRYEIYPEETYEEPVHEELKPGTGNKSPKIAIIIDDIGYNRKIAENLASLDSGLTFSVLPKTPHCRSIAINAHKKGIEIMMHLPMEPNEYPKINPGPGAILVSMSADETTELLKSHIAAIPWICGVNNHMGSRLTTHSSKMYQIFVTLKKENLFFIDSRTSPQSLCRPSARLIQLPFAERDVFLDHIQVPGAVKRQIRLLLKTAAKTGSAIGIGHPHQVTYEVLKEAMPEIKAKAEIVHASELVRPLGQVAE